MEELKKEIANVFDTLMKNMDGWLIDTVNILDRASDRATADPSWSLINRRMKTQSNRWYLMIEDALTDTEALLKKHKMNSLHPIIENLIKQKYESKVKGYQKRCFEILEMYKDVSSAKIDKDIVEEFLTIAKGASVDMILDILKENLKGGITWKI